MDEVIDDKGILFTRTKEYVKSNETVESTPKLNKKRSGARNENFFCVNTTMSFHHHGKVK